MADKVLERLADLRTVMRNTDAAALYLGSLHDDAAEAIGNPDQVWCHECGRTEPIEAAECLRIGWPMCCGFTMSLDKPEE